LLAVAALLFHRRPLGKHNFAMVALAILLVAAILHLGYFAEAGGRVPVIAWNLEQFTCSLALFTFALAIGETSDDLFYRVFVGLQVAFILLASLMILVITQTEKTDYLAGLRNRSDELAEFVRANVDYLRQGQSLPAVVEREDFLQRALWGFGHMPELRVVRIAAAGEVATFEVGDDGEIRQRLERFDPLTPPPSMNADEYFLIHALPLAEAAAGSVEFYGPREYLDRHIRKRIVIIFTLFTGIVVLSTFMIGLVVRGASATIRQQAGEIEQAQQQLLQASKLAAIGQLAAGVAHEINNPATTILSRASFLLSDGGDQLSASDREDIEAIVAQAHRIAHITNDLLQFSRPQVRRVEPVPIDRVIDRSLRLLGQSVSLSHITVEKALEPQLPRALANEESLIRALENLFRNAVDAMPEGGTLRIAATCEAMAHRLRLEIADSGTGIRREDAARIFDPFFTTKEVGKGTGLGLSIVHGTIKDHQGTITVESEPGEGARFVLTLPAEE
jgi:signal transduction histidine kinase